MHSLTNKTLSHLLIFLNELPLIRMQEDNLTGLRTIAKKTLHMLSGQWQVSMQEAVHMVDNQELVICSDMLTYVSLAQGQTLRYENDKSSSKDLITIYKTETKSTTIIPLSSTSTLYLFSQHLKKGTTTQTPKKHTSTLTSTAS